MRAGLINVVAKHGDGTRMFLMEKLVPALAAPLFSVRTWLGTLGDAELRKLGALAYERAPDDGVPSYLAVERLGMVCHLLARRVGNGGVVVGDILEECCDMLSVFAALVLCERHGYIVIRALPEIGPNAEPPVVEPTPKGSEIAGNLADLLRTVVVLH